MKNSVVPKPRIDLKYQEGENFDSITIEETKSKVPHSSKSCKFLKRVPQLEEAKKIDVPKPKGVKNYKKVYKPKINISNYLKSAGPTSTSLFASSNVSDFNSSVEITKNYTQIREPSESVVTKISLEEEKETLEKHIKEVFYLSKIYILVYCPKDAT